MQFQIGLCFHVVKGRMRIFLKVGLRMPDTWQPSLRPLLSLCRTLHQRVPFAPLPRDALLPPCSSLFQCMRLFLFPIFPGDPTYNQHSLMITIHTSIFNTNNNMCMLKHNRKPYIYVPIRKHKCNCYGDSIHLNLKQWV